MPVVVSGRLLPVPDRLEDAQVTRFEYPDIEGQCAEQLRVAHHQARQLILEAETQARVLQQEAERRGHATGSLLAEADFEAAVEAETDARVQARCGTLVPAIEAALGQWQAAQARLMQVWEAGLVGLALQLAEKILQREIQTRPQAPVPLIRDVLELSAGAHSIVIHLHPDDARAVVAEGVPLSAMAGETPVQIQPDPTITRGGCRLESDAGQIDARIDTQLQRLATELLGSDA